MHTCIKGTVHDFYYKHVLARDYGERCRSAIFRYMDSSIAKLVITTFGEYALFYTHLILVIVSCLYQNLLILGEICDSIVAIDNLLYC